MIAQLPKGSQAIDISATDINNNGYSLFASMAGGKSACLDFMATWCGPCWSFHGSQTLKNVHNNLGHLTTVVMMESDFSTNTNCLYGPSGCTGIGTHGNWVSGTPYPIINLTPSNGGSAVNDYNVNYYPTLYIISPDFRVWEITNRSYAEYYNWIVHSFSLNVSAQVTHSTCGDNGRVDLNPTGGYGTLKYKWSNGATTEDLVGIPGGEYEVTVTDANGYFETYGPWNVDGPDRRVDITHQTIKHNDCFGYQQGLITVQVAYGTPGYQFQWSNGNQTNEIDQLAAGSYLLTVTDAVGCTMTRHFNITQPAILKANITTSGETCDQKNGFIGVSAQGGTKPYYYDIGGGKKTSAVFDKLKAGVYQLSLTDSKQCLFSEEIFIDGTHRPLVEAGANASLFCGKDTLFLEGIGTETGADLIHSWSTKNGRIIGDSNTLQIRVVKEGTYRLYVKNLLTGCDNSDTLKVTDHRSFPDLLVPNDTLINCYHPEIALLGQTKTKSAKYFWTKTDTSFLDTSATILAAAKGSYVFNVLDTLNNCLKKDTVIVGEDLIPPLIRLESGLLNCIQKELELKAELSAAGLNPEIQWSTLDGRILSGENSPIVRIDLPGKYELIVLNTDNGCKTLIETTILEDKELPKIEFGVWPEDLSCLKTELRIGKEQPDPELNYSWSSHTGQIISDKTSHEIVINKAGIYKLHYSGKANGCEDSASIEIFEQTKLSPSFDYRVSGFEVEFADKSSGRPITWHWSMGDGQSYRVSDPVHKFAELKAYEVCLEVGNECGFASLCQLIDLGNSGNQLAFASWEIDHVQCFGGVDGHIKLQVMGGLPPYFVRWEHGSTEMELFGLSAGEYSVEIYDRIGSVIKRTFTIQQAPELDLNHLEIIHIRGNDKGAIQLQAEGGVPPYQFNWSNGEITKDIAQLEAGEYHLTITDAVGCSKIFGPFMISDLSSVSGIVEEHIDIYPQPANELIWISLGEEFEVPLRVDLYNSHGKWIKTEWFYQQGLQKLDLFEFPTGVYLLHLKDYSGKSLRKQLIVLRN